MKNRTLVNIQIIGRKIKGRKSVNRHRRTGNWRIGNGILLRLCLICRVFTDSMLLAFNKPYGVLSQFTPDGSPNRPLSEFAFPKNVYPIGRLDADSEGLLLLSDEPQWNRRLLHPSQGHEREYWVQVERVPDPPALSRLVDGLTIQGRETKRCRAWLLDPQPEIPPREPPIRFRKTVPTCWIALELTEGKNRQVRRMTAAVGHPTLRLIRVRIGEFTLNGLAPGNWRELTTNDRRLLRSNSKVG